jgi:hypothetical protein
MCFRRVGQFVLALARDRRINGHATCWAYTTRNAGERCQALIADRKTRRSCQQLFAKPALSRQEHTGQGVRNRVPPGRLARPVGSGRVCRELSHSKSLPPR